MKWSRAGIAAVVACALISACAAQPSGPPSGTIPGPSQSISQASTAITGPLTLPGYDVSQPVQSTHLDPGNTATTPAATTGAASTITVSSSSEPAPPRTVTILGSGDVLLHPQLWQQAADDADAAAAAEAGATIGSTATGSTATGSTATGSTTDAPSYDFGPLYASVAPEVAAADIAICELETPVGDPAGPFSGWPRFNVPPQVLGTLNDIGYDSCTTASNHTLDRGENGVIRTLDALDAAGLAHTGSARSEQEADTPLILTTDTGVQVGQLAYTFSFNGLHRPDGSHWLANRIDVPDILDAAAGLKRAGADIVVLSMHWGIEYDHLASDTQRQQAEQLLTSPDIDLILGSHAHVVQPMEQIGGKWVVYGMGNQVARHADPVEASREGIMPVITFTENGNGDFTTTGAQIVPTWMQLKPELRLIDLPRALADTALGGTALGGTARADTGLTDAERVQYQNIVIRISDYVNAYGAAVPVATVGG